MFYKVSITHAELWENKTVLQLELYINVKSVTDSCECLSGYVHTVNHLLFLTDIFRPFLFSQIPSLGKS